MQAEVEKLLGLIDRIVAKRTGGAGGAAGSGAAGAGAGDAIDGELARPAETTGVTSLRNSQVVKAFEQAAIDARIEHDAIRATLLIVHDVLSRALLAV